MSTAAFKARNLTTVGPWSPFADGGFDAAPGDVIEVQLEASPALDVFSTQLSCTDRSAGRTVPVMSPGSGIAVTPTSAITFTMPAGERGTWSMQVLTNGGPQLPDGTLDPDHAKTRYFAARTPNLDLRHPLAAETIEYIGAGGWAVALQELIDAVDAGSPGGAALATARLWVDALTVPAAWAGAVPTRATPITLEVAGNTLVPLAVRRIDEPAGSARDVFRMTLDHSGAGVVAGGPSFLARAKNATTVVDLGRLWWLFDVLSPVTSSYAVSVFSVGVETTVLVMGPTQAAFKVPVLSDNGFDTETGVTLYIAANNASALVLGQGAMAITNHGIETFDNPAVWPSIAKAALPSASPAGQGFYYVTDETGGATMAFSDGTNWRRVQDRAVVS